MQLFTQNDLLYDIEQKTQIIQRFDASSPTYEKTAKIQQKAAKILVSKLFAQFPKFFPNSILDLGSGTGFVAESLYSKFSKSHFTLNDMSPQMLEYTKNKFKDYSNFNFSLGDMESLEFDFHELIISNFAFQWIKLNTEFLQKLYLQSEILAFSCLLNSTFDSWYSILEKYNIILPQFTYPSLSDLIEYVSKIQPKTFTFSTKNFYMSFDDARSLMKHIKKLGASYGGKQISFHSLKNLIKTYNKKINIRYKVFFGFLKRI